MHVGQGLEHRGHGLGLRVELAQRHTAQLFQREAGDLGRQRRCRRLQQLDQGMVAVNELLPGVGDHHAGAGLVEGIADTQVFGGDDLLTGGALAIALDALAQVGLHFQHRLQQFADLVAAADHDRAIELAAGDFVGGPHRRADAATDEVGDQPSQHQTGDDAAGDHDHDRLLRLAEGRHALVLGLGGAAGVVVDQRIELADHQLEFLLSLAQMHVHGIVGQIHIEDLPDRIGRGLEVRPGDAKLGDQILLGRAGHQLLLVIAGDVVDVFHQELDLHARVFLDHVAGARKQTKLVDAQLGDQAAQGAGALDAVQFLVDLQGGLVQRDQALVADPALRRAQGQHRAERQHQLGRDLQISHGPDDQRQALAERPSDRRQQPTQRRQQPAERRQQLQQ